MTTQAIRLFIVLAIVGLSAFAYDWYYRKPARTERTRQYTIAKVDHQDETVYESYD